QVPHKPIHRVHTAAIAAFPQPPPDRFDIHPSGPQIFNHGSIWLNTRHILRRRLVCEAGSQACLQYLYSRQLAAEQLFLACPASITLRGGPVHFQRSVNRSVTLPCPDTHHYFADVHCVCSPRHVSSLPTPFLARWSGFCPHDEVCYWLTLAAISRLALA